MIDAKQTQVALLATISTLRGEGLMPTGPLYLALMNRFSLPDFQRLLGILEVSGLTRPEGDCIELTPAGLRLAEIIDAKLFTPEQS